MKPLFKMNHLLILLFACGIYSACTKDEAPVYPTPPTPTASNLISNGSFESTTQGWYRHYSNNYPPPWYQIDTNSVPPSGSHYFQYKQDAPTGGGNWSLQVNGGVTFQQATMALAVITGQSGTGVYQLSAWSKLGGCSSIGIAKKSSNLYTGWKYVNISDTAQTWKKYILTDTLTISATDTILIKISVGDGCIGFFDLIELNRLD